MTNYCDNYCAWNPWDNKPSKVYPDDNEYVGCRNKATVCVGAKGEWHLCEVCASLPRFRRYTVRKPLGAWKEKGND